jgi:hypothetical protein
VSNYYQSHNVAYKSMILLTSPCLQSLKASNVSRWPHQSLRPWLRPLPWVSWCMVKRRRKGWGVRHTRSIQEIPWMDILCMGPQNFCESDTHKEATGTYLEGKGSLKLGFSLKYSNKKLRCRHQGAAKKIHLFGNQVWRCSWWHRDNSTWLREPREELELWKSGVVSSLWRGRRWSLVKLVVDDSTSRFLWQIPTWCVLFRLATWQSLGISNLSVTVRKIQVRSGKIGSHIPNFIFFNLTFLYDSSPSCGGDFKLSMDQPRHHPRPVHL